MKKLFKCLAFLFFTMVTLNLAAEDCDTSGVINAVCLPSLVNGQFVNICVPYHCAMAPTTKLTCHIPEIIE
jgi:hypothetical protein